MENKIPEFDLRQYDDSDQCGCVLPEQSCPACEASAELLYAQDQANWFGGKPSDYLRNEG